MERAKPADIYGAGDSPQWRRGVAIAINWLLGTLERRLAAVEGYRATPFVSLAAAPSSPVEGQTYYDTTLHKVRTWDGTAWQDHF